MNTKIILLGLLGIILLVGAVADTSLIGLSKGQADTLYCLQEDGCGGGNASGTPAGNNTNVQYNDNGAFGGSDLFTFDGEIINVKDDAVIQFDNDFNKFRIFLGAAGEFNIEDATNGINYFQVLGQNNLFMDTNITASRFGISGQYYLPITDGSNGQALVTDGNGVVDWENVQADLNNSNQDLNTTSDVTFNSAEIQELVNIPNGAINITMHESAANSVLNTNTNGTFGLTNLFHYRDGFGFEMHMLSFYKARNNTIGDHGDVKVNDELGRITWRGSRDGAWQLGAQLWSTVTGLVSSNSDLATNMEFKVTNMNGDFIEAGQWTHDGLLKFSSSNSSIQPQTTNQVSSGTDCEDFIVVENSAGTKIALCGYYWD